jgi:hypothetical protein
LKEVICKCDKCGKHGAKTIIASGSEYRDAAGDTDYEFVELDICFDCAIQFINRVLDNIEDLSVLATTLNSITLDWKWQR